MRANLANLPQRSRSLRRWSTVERSRSTWLIMMDPFSLGVGARYAAGTRNIHEVGASAGFQRAVIS